MDTTLPEPPSVVPAARSERILYGLAVIVLPSLAFFGATAMEPEWQSGKFSDYAALLLNLQAAFLFLPLIVYSAVSLILLLVNPVRFASNFAVRFGIYTGVLLTVQYVILAAIFFPYSLASGPGLVALYWVTKKIGGKFGGLPALVFLLGILFFGILIFGSPVAFNDFWNTLTSSVPFLTLITVVSAAPVVCFSMMLMTALRLFRGYEIPVTLDRLRATRLGIWLTGYTAAWAFSIYQMFQLYAALPTNPPDCYIATAAAQGHPGFVGSHPVHLESGVLMVNRQLQTLKLAELALLALAPGLHRSLRRLYDILGRPLARRLTQPLLADLAYLTLKPAELIAHLILKRLIPNLDDLLARLYHSP